MIEKSSKQAETNLNDAKSNMLDELSKADMTVLTLAYMYARGFSLSGDDLTKAWTNAVRNNQLIEDVYRRGYEDALKDFEDKKRRDFYHKAIIELKE